jgi:L-ribulose-5-phosphate 4-epimerase
MKSKLVETLKLNKAILKHGLQIHLFGNASIRYKNLCLIKPSGVNIAKLRYSEVSVVNIDSGKLISGKKPSVDLDTHLLIYKNFPEINSIIHTHSVFATSWAQAKKEIPCFGTTHADYYYNQIPITKSLSKVKVNRKYEHETGKSIVSKIKKLKIKPLDIPGILVASHGPFCWGENANKALENALTVEYLAELAYKTKIINNKISSIPRFLQLKHYKRKVGPNSYYGQKIKR